MMRLVGLGSRARIPARQFFPHSGSFARHFGFFDRVKQALQQDEQLNKVREEIETEREALKVHKHRSAFKGWLHFYRVDVWNARMFKLHQKYYKRVHSPAFLRKLERNKLVLAGARQKYIEYRKNMTDEERKAANMTLEEVLKVKRKEVEEEIAVKRAKEEEAAAARRAELERLRPGKKSLAEEDAELKKKAKERKEAEKAARVAYHKEFIEKKLKEETETLSEEEIKKKQEAQNEAKAFPFAPQSTALTVGPEKTGWEKWREKYSLSNLKGTKFYQRGLEMKEKMEESDNKLLTKTLDTLGAASDVAGAVKKKVTSESESSIALGKIKLAWPHFDTNEFWLETVGRLPRIVDAFHGLDLAYIKAFSNPATYEILKHKCEEMCKSQVYPEEMFYPFIVAYPKSAEIITATTDDPLRPYIMLKFGLQKTQEDLPKIAKLNTVLKPFTGGAREQDDAEKMLEAHFEENIVEEARGRRKYIEDDIQLLFNGKYKRIEDVKHLRYLEEGLLAPTRPPKKKNPFLESIKDLLTDQEKRMNVKRKITTKYLQDCVKVVRADYVMVLVFAPERQEWLIHDFHEAKFDLVF